VVEPLGQAPFGDVNEPRPDGGPPELRAPEEDRNERQRGLPGLRCAAAGRFLGGDTRGHSVAPFDLRVIGAIRSTRRRSSSSAPINNSTSPIWQEPT
jgi:hypothetical protein